MNNQDQKSLPGEHGVGNAPSGRYATRAMALLMALVGVCLLPPVFFWAFSIEAPGNSIELWLLGALLLGPAVALFLRARAMPKPLLAILLSILTLVGIELTFRSWVVRTAPPDQKHSFINLRRSIRERTIGLKFVPHVYLNYTGAHSEDGFNPLGFRGALPKFTKPKGHVRVVTVGASTTLGVFPLLDEILKKDFSGSIDLVNFSMEGWSSTHSLVNLVLNVVDYSPDYVVIHHGWNDQETCTYPNPRGDHSHRYKPVNLRAVKDAEKKLVMISYVFGVGMLKKTGDWDSIAESTHGLPPLPEDLCKVRGDMYYFKRNLETMLHVLLARKATPVLATMPYSTSKSSESPELLARIRKANTTQRKIAARFGSQVLFIDLDRSMTKTMEKHFTDTAHMDKVGKTFKARALARAILGHLASKAGKRPSSPAAAKRPGHPVSPHRAAAEAHPHNAPTPPGSGGKRATAPATPAP